MTGNPRVGLFITCLVDLFRPSVGFAAIRLLKQSGCEVIVPGQQSCCGQPGYNSGDYSNTKSLAKQIIKQFESYDYVILPSGSCTDMIKHQYALLLKDDPQWSTRAQSMSEKCFELVSFLVDVLHYSPAHPITDQSHHKVTYHDTCTGLRALNIKQQPRTLLKQLCNIQIEEMQDTEVCCGFGGTFCVKYAEISEQMVNNKLANATATNAHILLGNDIGCLLNIAGRSKRLGKSIQVRHIAEVLADQWDQPAIGEPQTTIQK